MIGLVEAIRLGEFSSTHQTFNLGSDDSGGTCALLGAMAAVGWPSSDPADTFPDVARRVKTIPCGCYTDPSFAGWSIRAIIVHLNDVHFLSRNEIADIVARLLLEPDCYGIPAAVDTQEPVLV